MATLCHDFKRLTAQGSATNTPRSLTTMLVTGRQSAMAQSSLLENRFYVYVLRRPDKEDPLAPGRGCPFYVGKGNNGRIRDHRTEAKFLQHKPGRKSIKVSIIHKLWGAGFDYEEDILLENLTEREAFIAEIAAIATYGRSNLKTGCLANLTDGGEGFVGMIFTDEARQKMSDSHKGQVSWRKGKTGIYSEETLQKIREARKRQIPGITGKHHSEEAKRKMSESKKGQPAWNKGLKNTYEVSLETRQKLSEIQKGHLVSQETREKIGSANKGRILSEERKQRLREVNLGKKASLETRAKMSKSMKGQIRSEEAKQNMRDAWVIRRSSKGSGETF